MINAGLLPIFCELQEGVSTTIFFDTGSTTKHRACLFWVVGMTVVIVGFAIIVSGWKEKQCLMKP